MRIINKGTIPAIVRVAFITLASAWYSSLAYSASPVAASARANDLEQSRQLIIAGANVNLAEPDGTTPLLWAVYRSSIELVELLLDAGAEPNIANNLGISPLLQASRYGDDVMISMLLANGAILNKMAPGSEPLIMAAARSGSVEAVNVLLDAGASPKEIELIDNQNALMWAAAEGHVDVARVLLDAGIDPNAKARVSELTKRVNADFPSGGFAALHWAARNGNESMIRLLVENGADIDIKNGDNSTPMMLAIVNDRYDTAAVLLGLNANPNDGSLYHITVMRDATLDWRARDGTVYRADHSNDLSALDLTRLLLEAGADPNLPFTGQMHNASMCCDTTANSTPFYRAAVASDVEALKLMLEFGADTEWIPAQPEDSKRPPRGNIGKTALMVAINGGKGVGVAGGPNDLRQGLPQFREISNREPSDAVAVLLNAGANVDARDPNEQTALHIAATAGQIDIVRALVANGAALDIKNKDDLTPLELVEETTPRKATPGFFFLEPKADQAEIIATLKELAGINNTVQAGAQL